MLNFDENTSLLLSSGGKKKVLKHWTQVRHVQPSDQHPQGDYVMKLFLLPSFNAMRM
jgi:hypothetical protein